MRILLSILSDYLQPNFLLIKELEGKYDRLIFMTTAVMEEKKKQMLLVQAFGRRTFTGKLHRGGRGQL
jgi:hypothetical protein